MEVAAQVLRRAMEAHPLHTPQTMAWWLIRNGLVDEMAWEDPDGYDGGITRSQVYEAFEELNGKQKGA